MGTRNLTLVQLNGAYKIAQYGQWDGYPSGNGLIVLNFLRNHDIERFCDKVKHAHLVTEDELVAYWAELGIDINKEKFVSIEVSDQFAKLHPSLNRDMGAEILQYVYEYEGKIDLNNSLDFAKDSLFCEWAYVIDLDKNTFEVYEGFNKTPLTKEDRFYFDGYFNKEYYPIKVKKTYDLNDLPDEETFLADTEN